MADPPRSMRVGNGKVVVLFTDKEARALIGVVEGGDDVKTLAPLFRALDALKESVGWGKDGMM
jgi:hypothetical protein